MGLKILHLTQFLGVGGLEKILFLLIKEQIAGGHHVELVVYDYEKSWVEYFRSEGIIVNTEYRKKNGYDANLIYWLNQKVKGFDIVHTHDLNPLMYAAPLKLLRTLKFKDFPRLIHTAHGMDHVAVRPITKFYEKFCSWMTDITVAVSPAVKDFYIKKLAMSPGKVLNINNGTAVPPLSSDKEGHRKALVEKFKLNQNCHIWTCVARIVPLKNQHVLVEAARQSPGIELLVVGPSGDEEYWKSIESSCPSNVHIVGSRSDVDEILMGSDFFVSASRHEGIPVAALEAGAKAVPCLLSSIPGHLVLQDTTRGPMVTFFDQTDIPDLLNKMRFMEKETSKAKILAINFYEHVRANFSSERMYKEYLKAYVAP